MHLPICLYFVNSILGLASVHLLKQRKPNAPQDWLKKLPQMAKRLEESLYRSAKDFNEYNDATTLKSRLQQLAHSIGMKTKRIQQAQMAQAQQQQPPQIQQPQQQQAPHMGQVQYRPPPQQQPQHQQQPIAPMQPQPLQPNQPIPQHQQGQRIVNVAEINPIMSSQPQHQQQPMQVQHAPSAPMQYQSQQPTTAPMQQSSAPAQPQNGVRPPTSGARQVSDRQQVLRHQQQRLLLLRHAAKCQHEDGKCPVTPHCAGMKRLWKHIAECKDQKCLVPHCVSSRYVLSHYHRCKDVRCPVCGPVREAIHRSHEKQKQMQALKHRHQQAVQQSQQQQGAIAPQPIQPAPGVPSVQPLQYEPPNKRQRTSVSMPGPYQQQPGVPGAPGQPLQPQPFQPQSGVVAMPVQATPGQPYAYSQPGQVQQPRGSQLAVQSKPMIAAAPGVKFANGQVITPKFAGPKPQEDHTLINCFSIDQIETHIASLNNGLQLSPQKLKTKCLEALKVLQGHQHGWVFNSPVDPVELGLPDYFEVIKKPMDLGTIRKKLENNCYHSLDEFESHVHLTFDNAMLYNPEGSVVYNMAKEMKEKFEQDYEKLKKQLNEEEDAKRRNGEACSLCGCEKLLFEPPVFYCNGANCPSKRIRRNAYYFVGGNNQYHWCQQCFTDLKPNQLLELGDVSIRKEALVKKKNDELHEESWVQCDRCERWVHQICALFNTRQNKDQRSEFACPRCTIEERKKTGRPEATSQTPMAEDLQRTTLSEFLENHVRQKMKEHLDHLASEKVRKEGIAMEEAIKAVEMGGAITIRQVTSMDRKLEVRERMKKRYAFKNYPDEFTYRCKCIVVFQNLDGVDVILFGLYVYEHGESNPAPNTRTVYVSYLDSVHYMRPRSMRTFIYHEILISYLDYVRRRGFSTAHIWACPPLKGDDYILYAKPEDQKTPKDDRLRQWYVDMLVECQRRGIVGKLTNMYDLYFSNKENDATIVPYMEGDYFPAEVENIIKDLEDGTASKKKNSKDGKKKKGDKSKTQKKKGGGRGGTRSSGIDEDALKASGIEFPGMDQKSLEEGGRDFVMAKLGETIQPMKESFLVAFLAWKGAKEADMVVPKAIEEYRKEHNITSTLDSSSQDGDVSGKSAEVSADSSKAEDKEEARSDEDKPSVPTGDSLPNGTKASEGEGEGDGKAMDTAPENPGEVGPAPVPASEDKDNPEDADKDSSAEKPRTSLKEDTKSDEPPKSGTQINPTSSTPEAASTEDPPKNSSREDKKESAEGDADTTAKEGENASKVAIVDEKTVDETSGSKEDASSDSKEDTPEAVKEEEDMPMTNADDEEKKAEEEKSEDKFDDNPEDKLDEKPDKSDGDAEMKDTDDKTEDVAANNEADGRASADVEGSTAADKEKEPTVKQEEGVESDPKVATSNDSETAMEVDGSSGEQDKTSERPSEAPDAKPDNETVDSSGEKNNSESTQPDALESAEADSGSADPKSVPDQPSTSDASAKADAAPSSSTEEAIKPKLSDVQRSGKFAAMAKKRTNPDGSTDDEQEKKKDDTEKESDAKKETKVVPDIYVTDSKGRRVKVIDDDAEEMDCEFLNNRQAFLNLCQGNHYQFDHLRRAKHSSMMVLWHLHNRDAPKFVSQCATCSREILTGYRFHCPTCADFDQCHECYSNPNAMRHPHQLKAIPVTAQAQELTAEQRRERQRSIQLHMTLLQHAATCTNPKCPSANCAKMKGLLKHGSQCKIKAGGGCNVCKRIWALLQIHARQCKQQQCPVPNCMAIRERVRQLKKQQQAMDDRRRQEMNRTYRGAR
jgi:E1A/CREB-binding protein